MTKIDFIDYIIENSKMEVSNVQKIKLLKRINKIFIKKSLDYLENYHEIQDYRLVLLKML